MWRSMLFIVKSLITSCLLFVTLLITGIKNSKETNKAHEAVINKYKKIDILSYLEESDSSTIASVDELRASRTLFKQF